MKRKQFVAWVREGPDGSGQVLSWYRDQCDDYYPGDKEMRTVRLVEFSPAREAVVRAVVRFLDECTFSVRPSKAKYLGNLVRAARRLDKEEKKR